MQKYGIIEDGELKIVEEGVPGAKPIVYAAIPDFDQTSQAVFQCAPIDEGDLIVMGVEVIDVGLSDNVPAGK